MVITSIPDAEILVDGASKGSAGSPINLAPGQHAVTVQAKGYKPISKVVDIEPGKPRVERIEMVGDATTRKGAGADQRLSKVTLAGALALNEDFWSRPELRLYVTKANWDQAAARANAATFGANGKTSRTLVGVQYEVWW